VVCRGKKYNTVHRVEEDSGFQQHLLLLQPYGVSGRLRLINYLQYRLRTSEQWKRCVLACNWPRTHHARRICRNNPDLAHHTFLFLLIGYVDPVLNPVHSTNLAAARSVDENNVDGEED